LHLFYHIFFQTVSHPNKRAVPDFGHQSSSLIYISYYPAPAVWICGLIYSFTTEICGSLLLLLPQLCTCSSWQ